MRFSIEMLNTSIGVERINNYIARHGYNRKLQNLEKSIIATHNADYIHMFADYIHGVDCNKFTDFIIEYGDERDACRFGKYVKGANLEKLTDFIVKSENPVWIYRFADAVEGANKEKLSIAMAKTGDAQYIYRFAKNIKGANRKVLCSAMAQLDDASYILSFARTIPGADVGKLFESVLRIGDPEYVLEFIKISNKFSQEQINKATDIMLASKNIENITLFAQNAQGVDVEKVVKYVLSTKKAYDIHYFTIMYGFENCSKKQLDKLKEALERTGEQEYISSLKEFIEINFAEGEKNKTGENEKVNNTDVESDQ